MHSDGASVPRERKWLQAAGAGRVHQAACLLPCGLDPLTLAPLKPRRWLWMAAQTCSLSYREPLTPQGLLEVLTTGAVPPAAVATIVHFLEEAPIQVVVMAIEQAAQQSGVAIAQIWRHVDQIAAAWSSTRLRSMAA